MSWQATAWVSGVEAGGPSGKLLLYALANYADDSGLSYAGDERIMRDTELSERTIREWKGKLKEAGLISTFRRRKPGGDFDVDMIQLAMSPAAPPAKSAGGTTGNCRRDHRQLAPSPPADAAVPPTPPYIAEPPLEQSGEQSERGRAEDRREVERAFERFWQSWPTSVADSRPAALKAWQDLSPEDRQAAAGEAKRYCEATRQLGRKHSISAGTYLRERRWTQMPTLPAEKPQPVEAAPFGKRWMVGRFAVLFRGATGVLSGLTPFQRSMVAEGKADARTLMLEKQASMGFPLLCPMDDAAARKLGFVISADLVPLAEHMERVRVGSELWEDWKEEHRIRGWPWLPDPGAQEWVWFPAGGPEGLGEFETLVKGSGDVGRGRDAAA